MKTYFELDSRLTVLIEHLLKLAHVSGQVARDNFRGWNQTVRNQRRDLVAHIKANPGLKSKLTEELLVLTAAFPSSRRLSLDEIVGQEVVLALE
ncbi:MAG TPA: DUF29 family protein [Bryobacteraceae bacterium]|nr:DUF29 family protein [Bryobacteraceae bacterium]